MQELYIKAFIQPLAKEPAKCIPGVTLLTSVKFHRGIPVLVICPLCSHSKRQNARNVGLYLVNTTYSLSDTRVIPCTFLHCLLCCLLVYRNDFHVYVSSWFYNRCRNNIDVARTSHRKSGNIKLLSRHLPHEHKLATWKWDWQESLRWWIMSASLQGLVLGPISIQGLEQQNPRGEKKQVQ